MSKRRPSGDGMVRKRDDGRWEGRIVVGHKNNGDSIFRYIYADTQKELTAKLRQNIDAYQGIDLTEQSRMTLSEWLDQWLDRRMAGTVRSDTLDEICGTVPNLLINATDISFEGLWELVRGFGGVMFPAHVDKTANSLIANLGFIPPDSKFVTAEVKDLGKLHRVRRENPYLEGCRIISDSDAHYLEDIHEPQLRLQVRERSVRGVLEVLGI